MAASTGLWMAQGHGFLFYVLSSSGACSRFMTSAVKSLFDIPQVYRVCGGELLELVILYEIMAVISQESYHLSASFKHYIHYPNYCSYSSPFISHTDFSVAKAS